VSVFDVCFHVAQEKTHSNDGAPDWTDMQVRCRLHGAFFMCGSMSDKPFDAEACDIGGQATATNGMSDMKTPSNCVIDP
jgi:hypothetical protein